MNGKAPRRRCRTSRTRSRAPAHLFMTIRMTALIRVWWTQYASLRSGKPGVCALADCSRGFRGRALFSRERASVGGACKRRGQRQLQTFATCRKRTFAFPRRRLAKSGLCSRFARDGVESIAGCMHDAKEGLDDPARLTLLQHDDMGIGINLCSFDPNQLQVLVRHEFRL